MRPGMAADAVGATGSSVAPTYRVMGRYVARRLGLMPVAGHRGDADGLIRTVESFNAAVQRGEVQSGHPDGKGTDGITPPKSN
jgi:hypothetical protein